MGRVTGGDLVIELKQDVADLKRSFVDLEERLQGAVGGMQGGIERMQSAIERMHGSIEQLGTVVREGFGDIGRGLDRFSVHLEAHADVMGELRAKVNEHEDRLTALESKP